MGKMLNRMVRTGDPTAGAAQPAGPFASAMKAHKDFSVALARSLILKTPPAPHEVRRWKRNPWNESAQCNNDLIKKLAKAEQKHDFYSRL